MRSFIYRVSGQRISAIWTYSGWIKYAAPLILAGGALFLTVQGLQNLFFGTALVVLTLIATVADPVVVAIWDWRHERGSCVEKNAGDSHL